MEGMDLKFTPVEVRCLLHLIHTSSLTQFGLHWLGSTRKKLACGREKYRTISNQTSPAKQTRLLTHSSAWFG